MSEDNKNEKTNDDNFDNSDLSGFYAAKFGSMVFIGRPGGDGAHKTLVLTALKSGSAIDLEREARRGVEAEPDSIIYNQALALALWFDGKDEEAEEYFQNSLKLNSDKITDWEHLFLPMNKAFYEQLIDFGRYEDALKFIDKAMKHFEIDHDGKWTDFIKSFSIKSLSQDGMHDQKMHLKNIYFDKAKCLMQLRKFEEAMGTFFDVLTLDGSKRDAFVNLCTCFYHEGSPQSLEKLHTLVSFPSTKTENEGTSNTLVLMYMGNISEKWGRLEDAAEYYEACKKSDPEQEYVSHQKIETAMIGLQNKIDLHPTFSDLS